MKLPLTPEQVKELEIVFKAVDAGQVVVGQIRRVPPPAPDAGQFALFYTLTTQTTGRKIKALLEREREKRAAKAGQE
jgi:hypothetical protein